jgi:hypothetical protein
MRRRQLQLIDPVLRPLPISLRPVRGELLRSYVHRLALANHTDPDQLHLHLNTRARRTDPELLGRLALLSSQPANSLRQALPELGRDGCRMGTTHHWRPHPGETLACAHCLAIRGVTTAVQVFAPFYRHICLRHRQWTRTSTNLPTPRVAGCLDILEAQRRQLRLVRRHGHDGLWPTWSTACHLIDRLLRQGSSVDGLKARWNRRLALLGDTRRMLGFGEPMLMAASYPERVAVTTVLFDPRWVDLLNGDPTDHQRTDDGIHRLLVTRAPRTLDLSTEEVDELADVLSRWLYRQRVTRHY